MFDFFDVILKYIDTVVSYVINMFQAVLYVFGFIAQGILYIGKILKVLPPWVLPFIFAVIGFSVVMFIINR